MKISIIGAGNIGGAIARGLSTGTVFRPEDITVIDQSEDCIKRLKEFNPSINAVCGIYDSLVGADVVLIAVKPWLVEEVLSRYKSLLSDSKSLIVSVAATITLAQLKEWTSSKQPVFRVVPNTAISVKQSMTYVSSLNTNKEQQDFVCQIFTELGKAEYIDEKLIPAVTALTSCGIAFAFRYIRAAMEGGIEMGIYPGQAKDAVLQTLRGAIELLEATENHPEQEIDKVTTPGGITIKGLNEMEHAGFTSAVIRGLKASNVK